MPSVHAPRPPAPLVLRASRRKRFGLLLLFLVFVGTGFWMLGDDGRGWFVIVFFGVGAVVAVVELVWPGRLELTPTEMRSIRLARSATYEWDRCGAFSTWEPGGNPMVVFDYDGWAGSRAAKISRRLSGHGGALPDTYGMKAADLADLLNEYRRAATEAR